MVVSLTLLSGSLNFLPLILSELPEVNIPPLLKLCGAQYLADNKLAQLDSQ